MQQGKDGGGVSPQKNLVSGETQLCSCAPVRTAQCHRQEIDCYFFGATSGYLYLLILCAETSNRAIGMFRDIKESISHCLILVVTTRCFVCAQENGGVSDNLAWISFITGTYKPQGVLLCLNFILQLFGEIQKRVNGHPMGMSKLL